MKATKPFDRTNLRCAYIPHKRVQVVSNKPSKTRQEFKDECDVNVLMERFQKTGVLPQPGAAPRYLDTTVFTTDFREAMDILNEATASFMTLNANIRKEFDNDPEKFVAFALDKDNLEKLREWGLAPKPEPVAAPMRVEVVNPTVPPANEP